ncbi:MAG: rhomboid family intramembrane serine protease [Wenzhouxiangella sp.]|nr:MAG: rhomboid family intramembrane serine protease [Wenzhouxiangella sp.]
MLLATSFAIVIVSVGYVATSAVDAAAWVHFWGFRPDQVVQVLSSPLEPGGWVVLGGLLTALFLHADWIHLIGNLAYLWVFGISVEKAVGHWRFLLLFTGLGFLANAATAWHLDGAQNVVVIGASGGVSAIIGVYLGLFPGRRIGLWLPLGLFLQFARVPAILVIGSWFTLQLLYSAFGPEAHAVAWSAHLSGFALGLLAAVGLRLFPVGLNLCYRDE